ncbi:MAG: HAD-IIA family hydrolase [Microthrixaceae bacterium]|nr:HAD-IIA family hydrolase [Microthrixaceae bacterium]
MERPAGVLLDIDGLLVVSWDPVPGAVDAVARLRSGGVPVRFVTNTTSRSAGEIAASLRGVGFDLEDSELLTAGDLTRALLDREFAGADAMVLDEGPGVVPGSVTVVQGARRERARVVVVGGAGESFEWSAINSALRALLAGAALVGVHGAEMWRTDEGACLDGGAYLRMLASVSGVEPLIVGKPAPAMFEAACASIGIEPTRAAMVGDDLHSDVLAAQALGIRGVLVRTGKFHPGVLETAGDVPDQVIDSVASLPAMLGL